jgi:hypothetical protein
MAYTWQQIEEVLKEFQTSVALVRSDGHSDEMNAHRKRMAAWCADHSELIERALWEYGIAHREQLLRALTAVQENAAALEESLSLFRTELLDPGPMPPDRSSN